jgi:hypothetical protein
VQVLELAEEATSDPFSATEGYTAAKQEDDPFGLPPLDKAPPAPSAEFSDEIPF